MNSLLDSMIRCFYVIAIAGSCFSLYLIILSIYNYKKQEKSEITTNPTYTDQIIKQKLSLLEGESSPKESAEAFGCLIQNQYVLVHILQNRGNNYNDELQPKIYRKSLTAESMQNLFALEGQDGGYLF